LVSAREDEFEKEGQRISFQRLSLTPRGRAATDRELEQVQLPGPPTSTTGGRKREKKRRKARTKSSATTKPTLRSDDSAGSVLDRLLARLRGWRLSEAKKKRVPAFRILTDKALIRLATMRPRDEKALLEVSGIGPGIAAKYGATLLALVR
jgi:DNA topoisomerase-3